MSSRASCNLLSNSAFLPVVSSFLLLSSAFNWATVMPDGFICSLLSCFFCFDSLLRLGGIFSPSLACLLHFSRLQVHWYRGNAYPDRTGQPSCIINSNVVISRWSYRSFTAKETCKTWSHQLDPGPFPVDKL